MSEMTFYLNALIITIAVLAALLVLTSLLICMMRPVVRRNAVNTDLEQIGHEATVIKTIRPGKSGQIRYMTAEGVRTAPARADTTIRSGHAVLILSAAQLHFRVRRLTETEKKGLVADPVTEPAPASDDSALTDEKTVRDDTEIPAAPDQEANS